MALSNMDLSNMSCTHVSSQAIWATKISAHFGDNNVAQMSRRLNGQICSHNPSALDGVGGNRSKERDRKSELVLRSTYQIFESDRNNSDRKFYNVVRYDHIPLVP